MKRAYALLLTMALAVVFPVGCASAVEAKPRRRLTLAEYRDRMKGGWLGQIIGVGWALPTEFDYPSKIIPEDEVPEWEPRRIDQHFNDDIFFNIRQLKLLDRLGPDATPREVALDQASRAGRRGRYWARSGIAPPDLTYPRYSASGKWSFANLHMYSEFAGLVSPGMPGLAADLIRRYTMKCCETRYDGQFLAALNAEAFFETDIHALVEAGLEVIPPDSQYAGCIRDVVRWHRENPEDWQATWHRIQDKYFGNPEFFHGIDPGPGTGGAKIHGAYVVLGLLYGEGDLAKSIVITMRCGQDSDCSASNVGGILGVMMGADAIPGRFTEQLDTTRPFNHVDWNLEQTFAASERVAREVIRHGRGRIEAQEDGAEIWHPRDIAFEPELYMKFWDPPELIGSRFTEEEMRRIPVVTLRWALPRYLPDWETENAHWSSGYEWEREGRRGVLVLSPRSKESPVVLRGEVRVPKDAPAAIPLAGGGAQPWRLEARVNGEAVQSADIAQEGASFWTPMPLDLTLWRGEEVQIEIAAGGLLGSEDGPPTVFVAGLTAAEQW